MRPYDIMQSFAYLYLNDMSTQTAAIVNKAHKRYAMRATV